MCVSLRLWDITITCCYMKRIAAVGKRPWKTSFICTGGVISVFRPGGWGRASTFRLSSDAGRIVHDIVLHTLLKVSLRGCHRRLFHIFLSALIRGWDVAVEVCSAANWRAHLCACARARAYALLPPCLQNYDLWKSSSSLAPHLFNWLK